MNTKDKNGTKEQKIILLKKTINLNKRNKRKRWSVETFNIRINIVLTILM